MDFPEARAPDRHRGAPVARHAPAHAVIHAQELRVGPRHPDATMARTTRHRAGHPERMAHPALCLRVDGVELDAHLVIPTAATGMVILSETTGRSWHEPRTLRLADSVPSPTR